MKAITRSWETTVGGILAAAPIIIIGVRNGFNNGWTDEVIMTIISAIGMIVIGVRARDNGVRSERAGA